MLHRLLLPEGEEKGAYTNLKTHAESNMEGQGLEDGTGKTDCCENWRRKLKRSKCKPEIVKCIH
jgi:hypothetical protein